eukprot:6204343-Pleurochrysis_carterae.AAC.1
MLAARSVSHRTVSPWARGRQGRTQRQAGRLAKRRGCSQAACRRGRCGEQGTVQGRARKITRLSTMFGTDAKA